jgi:3-dehydroquinate dehydratase
MTIELNNVTNILEITGKQSNYEVECTPRLRESIISGIKRDILYVDKSQSSNRIIIMIKHLGGNLILLKIRNVDTQPEFRQAIVTSEQYNYQVCMLFAKGYKVMAS